MASGHAARDVTVPRDDRALVGLFVGGRSSRMGGAPKGLLRAPDGDVSIVERTLAIVASLGLDAVLVGHASAYAGVARGISVIDDDPPGIGPIGGLRALLRHAGDRDVIALACDLPFLSRALLDRLARDPRRVAVLAPRRTDDAPWEVLCARYSPTSVNAAIEGAVAAGEHGLQRLAARLAFTRLELVAGDENAIIDWDSPDDIV